MGLIRLQKYLAQCGIGSRRTCERYISEGRVTVDGKTITVQGIKVDPSDQIIQFDHTIVTPKPISWIMLYKPPKYLSTTHDPSGKPTFLELLPEDKHYLFAVGRLDFLSEGLLLLTNDGDIANKLIHPRYGIEKEYLVTTPDKITSKKIDIMKKGVFIQQDFLSVNSIYCTTNDKKKNLWEYSIIITEGKNRHIRRMLKHVNIRLKKLKRIRIGPIRLTNLSIGEWRYLTKEEINQIHYLIGNS